MRTSLHTRVLLGFLVGSVAGVACHAWLPESAAVDGLVRWVTQPLGQLFLRLLFMLIVPLIFSALVMGVAGLSDLHGLGRIGLVTLVYTVVVSAIAVVIGVGLVQWLRPGDRIDPELRAELIAGSAERAAGLESAPPAASGLDLLLRIVPNNPIRAAADGDMLAVMFFSLLFGIAVASVRSEPVRQLERAIEGLYEVSMHLITLVLKLAPYAVAALLFTLSAELGFEILGQLALYVAVVILALALHLVVTYSLAVRFLGGMAPLRFFRGIRAAMVMAFSTASSNATLPTALRVAERDLALPPQVSRFVLTIGATANQNGTALFEGVTVLFLAQLYGVDLTLLQQVLVVGVCILGGIGTAGVPAGSIPVVAMILGMVGVPVEGIGVILGVDRLLDMCRTVLNVSGDLAASVVVARQAPPAPATGGSDLLA